MKEGARIRIEQGKFVSDAGLIASAHLVSVWSLNILSEASFTEGKWPYPYTFTHFQLKQN